MCAQQTVHCHQWHRRGMAQTRKPSWPSSHCAVDFQWRGAGHRKLLCSLCPSVMLPHCCQPSSGTFVWARISETTSGHVQQSGKFIQDNMYKILLELAKFCRRCNKTFWCFFGSQCTCIQYVLWQTLSTVGAEPLELPTSAHGQKKKRTVDQQLIDLQQQTLAGVQQLVEVQQQLLEVKEAKLEL